jgi:molecular chaperone DnaK
VSARDVDTGTRQSITVTSTSGLSEEELKKMTEQNAEYMVAVKNDQRFEELRGEVEPLLKECDALAAQFRAAVAGSDYGLDIAEKAARAAETARSAIKARDYNQLSASKESLERSVQIFRAVVQKLGKAG